MGKHGKGTKWDRPARRPKPSYAGKPVKMTDEDREHPNFPKSSMANDYTLETLEKMSDAKVEEWFRALRWAENEGRPICPRCGNLECSVPGPSAKRTLFRCRATECRKQFSLTSGTVFHSRKKELRFYVKALLLFMARQKGANPLEMRRGTLKVSCMGLYVILQKYRETMCADMFDEPAVGEVQIDGKKIAGFPRQPNMKSEQPSAEEKQRRKEKKLNATVMVEVGGRVRTIVTPSEWMSVPWVRAAVDVTAKVVVDGSKAWEPLKWDSDSATVNHSEGFSVNGVDTNRAEGFFSLVERMLIGHHHSIGPRYAQYYVGGIAAMQNLRKLTMLEKTEEVLSRCLRSPKSPGWTGYYQEFGRDKPHIMTALLEGLKDRFIEVFGEERWNAAAQEAAKDRNPYVDE